MTISLKKSLNKADTSELDCATKESVETTSPRKLAVNTSMTPASKPQ